MRTLLLQQLAILTLLSGVVSAAPLVGSTFEDSALGSTGRTTVVTTNNSNLTPWYLATSTTASRMVVVDDTGTGGFGKSVTLARLEAGITNFSPQSLLDGQSLTISFDYHYTADPVSGAEGLRILLYSSGAAPLPSADAVINSTSVLADYSGYYFSIGTGTATAGASQTFIRERDLGNTGALNSSAGTSLVGGTTAGVTSGASDHNVQISLSRSSDVLNLSISVDGVSLISHSDSDALFDFNTLMISNNTSTTGGSIYLDNIQVVPEPGVASLVGGGILLLTGGSYLKRSAK